MVDMERIRSLRVKQISEKSTMSERVPVMEPYLPILKLSSCPHPPFCWAASSFLLSSAIFRRQ